MMDVDGDDEWEEETVLVELNGLVDQEWISNTGHQCKIVGIDSANPILQLGRTAFCGEYKDAMGTKVLFEVQSGKGESGQPEDGKELSLKYSCHTSKLLSMQRIFLSKREDDVPCAAESDKQNTLQTNLVEKPSGKVEGDASKQ